MLTFHEDFNRLLNVKDRMNFNRLAFAPSVTQVVHVVKFFSLFSYLNHGIAFISQSWNTAAQANSRTIFNDKLCVVEGTWRSLPLRMREPARLGCSNIIPDCTSCATLGLAFRNQADQQDGENVNLP